MALIKNISKLSNKEVTFLIFILILSCCILVLVYDNNRLYNENQDLLYDNAVYFQWRNEGIINDENINLILSNLIWQE